MSSKLKLLRNSVLAASGFAFGRGRRFGSGAPTPPPFLASVRVAGGSFGVGCALLGAHHSVQTVYWQYLHQCVTAPFRE